MESELQRRVQRYGWDKAAAHYETFWASQLQPAQDLLLRLADIQAGEKVIELACGTGLVTFRIAEQLGSSGRLVATDLSGKMVNAIRAEAERRGVNAEVARMDAEALEYPDGAFDVAICALGLMYCPSPALALREMYRVLAPGGRAAAAVWGARSHCGWAEIFPIVERRVASDVCPLFFQLGSGNALELSFQAAGFRDTHSTRIQVALRYASADDAIGAAFAGGPVALAYSRFDAATRESAHADYLESIATYRSEDGYEIPGEFVVVTGAP
ncbi:MAG: class I SAM-dependent methyltransferase [Vicinamibacterales bacterium]